MKSFYVSYKGAKIHCRTAGKGKAIVLLHGYCEDSAIWESLVKKRSAKNLFVCIDLPGFGQSELLKKPYTMRDLADMVNHIAAETGIGEFTLMGHSMGGYVALEFASRFPDRLTGLGLIHSHCFTDAPEKIANRKKSIDFIQRHGTAVFLRGFYANLFAPKNMDKHIDLINQLHARNSGLSAASIIQGAEALIARSDRSETLKHFPKPVFMFCGGKDNAIDSSLSFNMASLPAFCDFHFLPACGHMGMFEARAEFYRTVGAFLERGEC